MTDENKRDKELEKRTSITANVNRYKRNCNLALFMVYQQNLNWLHIQDIVKYKLINEDDLVIWFKDGTVSLFEDYIYSLRKQRYKYK